MITKQSAKQKGKRLERQIAGAYRSSGLFPKAQAMPMSGGMTFHKGDILKGEADEWVEEVKNQEKVKLWEFWKQSESQCTGLERPLLHISGNFRPILSVMRFDDLLQLRLELKQLRQEAAELMGRINNG